MGTQEEYSGTVSAPRDQGKEFTWKLILTKHSEGFNRKGFYGKEDQENVSLVLSGAGDLLTEKAGK